MNSSPDIQAEIEAYRAREHNRLVMSLVASIGRTASGDVNTAMAIAQGIGCDLNLAIEVVERVEQDQTEQLGD